MRKVNAEESILRYEYLYYNPESIPDADKRSHYGKEDELEEEYQKALKIKLNIGKLNCSDYRAEQKVMKLLCKSTFDEVTLAWKAGRVAWRNNQLETDNFAMITKSKWHYLLE